MNRSQCRQSAGVDARSKRHQVVHCVRGEHFTSCFCRHDVLRFGGVDDWCQANGATRCATGPALRDIMSVHEAGRCQQEHHGVEQASAEIGASFWAGGRGGSRGRQSVPIGMPLDDAKSPRNQAFGPSPWRGGNFWDFFAGLSRFPPGRGAPYRRFGAANSPLRGNRINRLELKNPGGAANS